jgi:hypothetical protein
LASPARRKFFTKIRIDRALTIPNLPKIFLKNIFDAMPKTKNNLADSWHWNILSEEQNQLLPLIRAFRANFILVGGTAIALYIGHRRSIDFDLFCCGRELDKHFIRRKMIGRNVKVERIIYEDAVQWHALINRVKLTFFNYPYRIEAVNRLGNFAMLPSLLDLAAMKALALGGRAKWKDYIDLYYLLTEHFSLDQISKRAKEIFHSYFSEKLFRQQLCYFKDIDKSERIEGIRSSISDRRVMVQLTKIATEKV